MFLVVKGSEAKPQRLPRFNRLFTILAAPKFVIQSFNNKNKKATERLVKSLGSLSDTNRKTLLGDRMTQQVTLEKVFSNRFNNVTC